MDTVKVNEKLYFIHDQTISTLHTLGLPPLPHHYKKYFDEIFEQTADNELLHLVSDEEKSISSHDDLARYLDIAHRTIDSFIETHADISHVAKLQETYISKASKEGVERCINFVDGLSELGKNMSLELKKAQTKIDELQTELEDTITQLTLDPLTKVSNRKGLIEDLSIILQAGESKDLPVVLLMIDADDFKIINDQYGHVAGDKVLYFFAQSIKSILRKGDKVYRFGGEEFSVVLNRCDKEQALQIADKIRSKIEQSHLIYGGKSIKITVSIGATIHHNHDSYDDFVTRADEALYQAKNAGKNRTILTD